VLSSWYSFECDGLPGGIWGSRRRLYASGGRPFKALLLTVGGTV
jgi:hypothetical protein